QSDGERLRNEFDLGRYEVMEPQVRALANAYLLTAFHKLGWTFKLHQRIVPNLLIENLGIAPQHHRLVQRMLKILAEDGVLADRGDEWEILQLPEERAAEEVWQSLWHQFPGLQAELMLVRQCGERLAEVLSGTLDPLEAIFPQGSLTTAEHLY